MVCWVLFSHSAKSLLHFADIHRDIPLCFRQLPLRQKNLEAWGLRRCGSFFYFHVCAAFPQPLTRSRIPTDSDCYAPSDSLGWHWDVVRVAPYLLPTSLIILPRVSRVHCIGLKAECCRWRVLTAPSTLCGFPITTRGSAG